MRLRKQNTTQVMPLIFMLCFGITGVDMKFLKGKQKRIRSKQIILNFVITWPVSPDRLVVSHVAPMLWRVPFAGSSFATTIARLSNAYIQIIPIISSTSFTYPFRHSLKRLLWIQDLGGGDKIPFFAHRVFKRTTKSYRFCFLWQNLEFLNNKSFEFPTIFHWILMFSTSQW